MIRPRIILIAFLLLLAATVFYFSGRNLDQSASAYIFSKLKKLQALGSSAQGYGLLIGFRSGSELILENRELKRRIEELEAEISVLKLESSGGEKTENLIPAGVIFRPPQLAYDELIIDKGANDGLSAGKPVLVGEYTLAGELREVFAQTSRVILLSSFGREQNVFLEKSRSAVLATGRGSQELEVILPRDFPAEAGEKVFSFHQPPYLVGIVEKVVSLPTSPTKKLKIRQPFNLNNLRSVNIPK